ncbi:hypothetical protein M4I21_18065 [Cellulophaga sp. 20_2_10]|uniref:hypothetical protein n=1 Tax=Cellulophaga sp. 20_2_10 TaxID=2942476 RepID=UPI00201A6E0B|nr:hypothetical protein [Cellulophaga sp. 20_2_10]MCL5247724.1 hypothetical protein [Cellulophaga sp. 20_2_10]
MRLLILFLLLTNISFGQTSNRFDRNFDFENEIKNENLIDSLNSYDFSNIWTKTKNSLIRGIIGEDHQRIKLKLISITKKTNNLNEYLVTGKSSVKGTICDFSGVITLVTINKVKKLHFGVDGYYADKGIKSQGILIASYEFNENIEQKYSGTFKGKLYSKWYLNSENKIIYDDIESNSDSYMNNAFVGIWKSYKTLKEKKCNWADFRIPNANQDFDIGAGEFSPNEKYLDKGWENYSQAWIYGDKEAQEKERKMWWK